MFNTISAILVDSILQWSLDQKGNHGVPEVLLIAELTLRSSDKTLAIEYPVC